jgi:hypothetical protein
LGIAHDHAHAVEGHAQFVGDGLGQGGAGVLPNLDFAGEGGHGTVFADVQPGADFVGKLGRLQARAGRGFLQRESVFANREHGDAGAHKFEEIAAVQREVMNGTSVKFVAFGLDDELFGEFFGEGAHWARSRTALAAR